MRYYCWFGISLWIESNIVKDVLEVLAVGRYE